MAKLEAELRDRDGEEGRKKLLMGQYPSLFMAVLRRMGRESELTSYMDHCRQQREGDFLDYSLYVHGYVIPRIKQLRRAGRLKHCRWSREFKSVCRFDAHPRLLGRCMAL